MAQKSIFFSAEMYEVCEMEDNDSFLQTGLRWQADSSKWDYWYSVAYSSASAKWGKGQGHEI